MTRERRARWRYGALVLRSGSRARRYKGFRVGALTLLPALFLGYFFVYPLVRILVTGLAPQGRIDFGPFQDVVASPDLRGVAWFTLWQAAASTVLTIALGLPAAYVLARYRFPGRNLVRAIVAVPFVLPTVVVGSAFLALLSPSGPLGLDLRRTVWAILIAHVFYNYSIVVRTVSTFWARLDPRLEDAARVLGAGRWRTWREVTLPLLAPAIASAASIVFLFSFTSFGVILILGGFEHATLEVEIWRQTTRSLNLPVASVLAILQLTGVGAALSLYGRLQRRWASELDLRPDAETAQRPFTLRARLVLALNLMAIGLLVVTPLAVLVERSLSTTSGYGLDWYRWSAPADAGVFVPVTEALANSIRFAMVATVLATALGLMAAVVISAGSGPASRGFDGLLMLPLGTSAVTIGFGFLVALDRPIDLRTSQWLIPIAHALIAIPFVVRAAVPVMRSVRMRLREAATTLGASPGRVWREVDLPLVSRAALVGAGFAFAVSLGEFGATSFVARPDSPTLPLAIFRLLRQPGQATFGRAMALSTVLMVLTGVAVISIERLRVGRAVDF